MGTLRSALIVGLLAAVLVELAALQALPAAADHAVLHATIAQAPDGTLYLLQAENKFPLTPVQMSDEELARKTMAYAIPNGMFWLVAPAPTALPTYLDEATPPVLRGSRAGNTRPFPLAGGSYQITWSATSSSGGTCFVGGTLRPTLAEGKDAARWEGEATQVPNVNETWAYGVPSGIYYLRMNTGCREWTVIITPGAQATPIP